MRHARGFALGVSAALVVGTAAQAGYPGPIVIQELEINDSLALAQLIAPGRVFDLGDVFDLLELLNTTVSGRIEAGDVDYFRVDYISTGGVSLMDIEITGGAGVTVQAMSIDALNGLVLDFVSFDNSGTASFQIDNLSGVPGARSVIFAITGGHDLDPIGSNGAQPFGVSPIFGSEQFFDGVEDTTGQAHGASFGYALRFVPQFVPAPGVGAALLGAAGLAACRRRRG